MNMKNSRFNKWRMLPLLLVLFLSACDKQGPMGPSGNPGADGADGAGEPGGGVLVYQTAESATINWEFLDGWQDDIVYTLTLNNSQDIAIPDSAANYFSDGGSLVVYAQDDATNLWYQLPYMPLEREIYSYYFYEGSNGARIRITARVDKNLEPITIRKLKISLAAASQLIEMPL